MNFVVISNQYDNINRILIRIILENMLDPVTNETIYASNGCDEIHESEDTGNEDITEDNNLKSNIRRRKGKIISCAKETIEQGKQFSL